MPLMPVPKTNGTSKPKAKKMPAPTGRIKTTPAQRAASNRKD